MLTLIVSRSSPPNSLTLWVGLSTPSLKAIKIITHRPIFQVIVDSVARIRAYYVTEVRAQCF